MKAVKPHKRLILRIQEMYYRYFERDYRSVYLYVNFQADNAEKLIGLLCGFNAKLLVKFQLYVHGIAKIEALSASWLHCVSAKIDGLREVSLLTYEAFAEYYLARRLNFAQLHLFSLISEQDLRRAGCEVGRRPLSSFLRERVAVNRQALANLQKAICIRQMSVMKGARKQVRALSVMNSAMEILYPLQMRGKTVLVGFSGGKDSAAVYLALRALYTRFGYYLKALCFDPKFNKFDRAAVQAAADACGIELGFISEDVKADLEDISVCVSCARARRRALLREKIDFLALGHHLQDAAETALMTGIHNGEFFELRGSYMPRIDGEEDDVRIIRPLIYCKQSAVLEYLREAGVDANFVSSDAAECEMAEGRQRASERSAIREFLNDGAYEWFL